MMNNLSNQLIVSLFFNLFQAATILLTVRLSDSYLPPESLALVFLFRRQGNLWANVCQFGASQTIQRYRVSEYELLPSGFVWSSLIKLSFILTLSFFFICIFFGENIIDFLIGASEKKYIFSFAIYVCGLAFCYLGFSSWLTEFRFVRAYSLDFWVSAGLFLIGLILFKQRPVADLLLWLGVSTFIISVAFLFWFVHKHEKWRNLFSWHIKLNKEILNYAWTRNVTAFVEMGLFVIIPWQFRENPEISGPLLIVYVFIRFLTFLSIIGRVVGLRVISSRYKASKFQDEKTMVVMLLTVLALGFATIPLYYWLGHIIVKMFVPNSNAEVMYLLDHLVFFIPAIGGYYLLRNFVELKVAFPVNLLTLLVAGILVAIAPFFYESMSMASAITGNVIILSTFYLYVGVFLLYALNRNLHLINKYDND